MHKKREKKCEAYSHNFRIGDSNAHRLLPVSPATQRRGDKAFALLVYKMRAIPAECLEKIYIKGGGYLSCAVDAVVCSTCAGFKWTRWIFLPRTFIIYDDFSREDAMGWYARPPCSVHMRAAATRRIARLGCAFTACEGCLCVCLSLVRACSLSSNCRHQVRD